MASRLEYIYDLKRLLSKGNVTDDSRLNNNHLGFLLDQRRAKEIRDSYKRNPVIEPIWIQDYGLTEFTPVNKNEDSSIVSGITAKFSKAILPSVVSLIDPISNTHDLGTYSIRSSDGKNEFQYLSADKLFLLTEESVLSKISSYIKIGNAVYLTPQVRYAKPLLVLESPLDGYVFDDLYIPSGNLVIGTVYVVAAGQVTHNSIKYNIGSTFTAASTTFTGLGKVQYNNQKRRMLNSDPYPMSSTMAEVVKMKILTQDFAVEQSVVSDVKNDSKDDANR
ncbi:MAG: hypothetical protein IT212_07620 [Bacteroidia bacterium]|nr:hypothetical protein [Bacteroidia bacterium]